MSAIIAIAAVLSILGALVGIIRFFFRWAHARGVSAANEEFTTERQALAAQLAELQQKSESQRQRIASQLTKAKIRLAVERQAKLKAEEELRRMTELAGFLKDQLDPPDSHSRGA